MPVHTDEDTSRLWRMQCATVGQSIPTAGAFIQKMSTFEGGSAGNRISEVCLYESVAALVYASVPKGEAGVFSPWFIWAKGRF